MKKLVLLLCVITAVVVNAQTTPASDATATNPSPATVGPDVAALIAARQVLSDMASGIVNGTEQADAALVRLSSLAAPSGLPVDPAADFGYAAIDVGNRLISARRPAEAEKFFRAAEASLATLVGKTPDADAWNKAQFLQQLAVIRSWYLNNAAQAKIDIEQAMALQPGNAKLQQVRALIANEHASLFSNATPKS